MYIANECNTYILSFCILYFPFVEANQQQKRKPPHGGETRKRKSNPFTWKQQTRKRLRQSGKQYINTKGVSVAERSVQNSKKNVYLIANFNAYRKSLKKNAKGYLTIFGLCHKLKNNITVLQQQNDLIRKDVVQTKMYQDDSIHIAIILFWKT